MIEKKIISAFKGIQAEKGIELKDIRVMLMMVNNDLNIVILNGSNFIENTTIDKIISLSTMEKLLISYEKITNNLIEKLKKIFTENNISDESGNVRLYVVNDEPKAYLFDNSNPIKPINKEDLLS